VIEAIAERMDWKLDLYTKIAPALAPHAIVASNTSGLSITKLSEALPEPSSRASAASTSSTRRATWRWWS
jgi:3-hydroxyacyl-CoA dehydrogenase